MEHSVFKYGYKIQKDPDPISEYRRGFVKIQIFYDWSWREVLFLFQIFLNSVYICSWNGKLACNCPIKSTAWQPMNVWIRIGIWLGMQDPREDPQLYNLWWIIVLNVGQYEKKIYARYIVFEGIMPIRYGSPILAHIPNILPDIPLSDIKTHHQYLEHCGGFKANSEIDLLL